MADNMNRTIRPDPPTGVLIPAPAPGEALETLTAERRRLLREQVCPPGTTDDEFALFLAIAQRSGLDPFMRQIYMVPRRQRVEINGEWRWQTVRRVETSIGGLQLLATRTNEHDGREGPEWYDGERWTDVWEKDVAPVAARVRIYRRGARVPFTGTAHYREFVQRTQKGDPTRFWAEMPAHMLAKCAEAIALRAAFPAELQALYVPEERRWDDAPGAPGETVDAVGVTVEGGDAHSDVPADPSHTTKPPAALASPTAPPSGAPPAKPIDDIDGASVILRADGLTASQVAATVERFGSRAAACGRWIAGAQPPTFELSVARLDALLPAERVAIATALADVPRTGDLDVDPAEIPEQVGA